MDFGIQLHLPTLRDRSAREIVDIAASAAEVGFTQIWLTDNLGSRSLFAMLAAMATSLPCDLGTAVIGQYFHNPVEMASALATTGDLMDGRRLYAGIGTGNPFTGATIQTPQAIRFLRETARCTRRLLAGERVQLADYPTVASYFRFSSGAVVQLDYVDEPSGVKILGGGNGPLGLAAARDDMDGIILGWSSLPALRVGRLPGMLSAIAKPAVGRNSEGFIKVLEIKVSVASKRSAARDFIRRSQAPSRILNLMRRGYTIGEFEMLGIPMSTVTALEAEHSRADGAARRSDLVADSMIDWLFVAGDTEYCASRLIGLVALARGHGVQQVMLSVLGPEPLEAVGLLAKQVIPSVWASGSDS